MDKFEIGEIAIITLSSVLSSNAQNAQYNGEECEIIGGLQDRLAKDTNTLEARTITAYRIRVLCDNAIFVAEPQWLRKKRPPRKDLEVVRWSDIPWWQPNKVII